MTDAQADREGDDRGFYAERRAINHGFSDAMARAVELAVTPTIFGFLGWLLDGWLGTRPLFMLALGLFTAVYVGWRMMTGYDEAMRQQEAKLFKNRERP